MGVIYARGAARTYAGGRDAAPTNNKSRTRPRICEVHCKWENSSKFFQASHLLQPKVQTVTTICERFVNVYSIIQSLRLFLVFRWLQPRVVQKSAFLFRTQFVQNGGVILTTANDQRPILSV